MSCFACSSKTLLHHELPIQVVCSIFRGFLRGATRGVMTSKRGNKNFYKGVYHYTSLFKVIIYDRLSLQEEVPEELADIQGKVVTVCLVVSAQFMTLNHCGLDRWIYC